MTPSYEDRPTGPPKKPGMPGWAWALIGCGLGGPLLLLPILAAILFPVFAQSREKARQVSCLSNLKQQSLAVIMYSQDYDETLPPKNAKWMDLAAANLKNEKTFHCPSLKGGVGYGYAMNPEPLGKKVEKIAHPEDVPLIFDSAATPTERNVLASPESSLAPRHSRNMANIAFLDGHAKGVSRP